MDWLKERDKPLDKNRAKRLIKRFKRELLKKAHLHTTISADAKANIINDFGENLFHFLNNLLESLEHLSNSLIEAGLKRIWIKYEKNEPRGVKLIFRKTSINLTGVKKWDSRWRYEVEEGLKIAVSQATKIREVPGVQEALKMAGAEEALVGVSEIKLAPEEEKGREFALTKKEKKEAKVITDLGAVSVFPGISVEGEKKEKRIKSPKKPLSPSENLYWEGIRLAQQGDIDGAIKKYNKALVLDPDRVEICENFILALFRRPGHRKMKEEDRKRAIALIYEKGLDYQKIEDALIKGKNVIDFN